MDFLYKNKWLLISTALLIVLAVNHTVVAFGFNTDFIGILFSVGLFFIGGRSTTFKVNYLLIGLIVILEFVSYRLHTKSLHFLALLLLICLIYYQFSRKFSYIALICILLFATVFNKLFDHLTTEIKQALCENVYVVLKNFMQIEKREGVNFYINGAKVSIDTACMGLSMFKTGFLVGALLLTIEERKKQLYFSISQIVMFCIAIITLNILSNYFRIITLILLNCTEENMLHHAVGIMCFIVYQVLPMLYLIRFFKLRIVEVKEEKVRTNILPIGIAFAIIIFTSIELKNELHTELLTDLDKKYAIQDGIWVNKEVFKIETPDKLIYFKTPLHNPLICWTGTGYKITVSKEILCNNEKIWYNEMEKNNVRYKSIWWYESGGKKYTSFMEVMLKRLIYGNPLRLINETSVLNETIKPKI